ncbi:MAG TPA: hypothetical protein VJC39_04080 [Candidatus Nanoarchaeia archaeon]|nr:hypothetical protein [Candidatus Nanoarchaeia archaeon]
MTTPEDKYGIEAAVKGAVEGVSAVDKLKLYTDFGTNVLGQYVLLNAGYFLTVDELTSSIPEGALRNAARAAAGLLVIPLNTILSNTTVKDEIKYIAERHNAGLGSGIVGWGKTLLLAGLAYVGVSLGGDRLKQVVGMDSDEVEEVRSVRVDGGVEGDYPTDFDIYPPHSEKAIKLFEQAAPLAGVPVDWASKKSLHSILAKESGGKVGLPNYTIRMGKRYGSLEGEMASKHPEVWPIIHQYIRDEVFIAELMKNDHIKSMSGRDPSGATGLGQLLGTNAAKYYPSGRAGIGNPLEEAAGMLAYIKAAYKDPETALECYGKKRPAKCPWKNFQEGY